MYFDGNGNAIDLGNQNKAVTTTVLGYDLPEDVSVYGVSSEYAAKMKEAIEAWGASYAGDDKQIPFIVHTDQHGRLDSTNTGLFDLLSYLVNWDETSAIFNLGDTVVDHWIDDDINTNPLLRNAELEAALKCVHSVPLAKQINVFGNHDTWYSGNEQTAVAGTLPSLKYNNPYFHCNGLRTVKLEDNSGMFEVFDDKHKVRYLIVAAWDYAAKQSGNTGYQWYYVSNEHLQWIISKMQENTGYDLVLVSHVPLQMGGAKAVDPITGDSITKTNPTFIEHYMSELNALWSARKSKESGTIRTSISYDFTNCTDKLLCALAGHTHYDGVDYVGDAGVMQVAFDWFADLTIHFGLIDRRNNQIKCWKLHNESSTPGVQTWTKPFDYVAPGT